MSYNLAARFVPAPGVIRTRDTDSSSYSTRGSHANSVLVIIDNIMNLALLVHAAAHYTHNETLLDIAISHANKTRDNHVRKDGPTFHVCDYSATTDQLYLCRRARGLANNSTWSRGQAWAIYGFAQMYSLTRHLSLLEKSMRTAENYIEHLPDNGLASWDFDAPYIPKVTPRDSSSTTIAASGLLLVQTEINKSSLDCRSHKYIDAAVRLLTSVVDLARAGELAFGDSDASTANETLGAVT